MKNIITMLKGAVFGISNIIPGVSGGTMAVIMNVFDKLIDIFSVNFKKIKENWKFILFFGLGAVIGLVAAAFALKALFETYFVPTQMFFTGVVVGSIPFIWKEAVKENKFRKINIIPLVVGILIMLSFVFIKGGAEISASADVDIKLLAVMVLYLFIAAFAMIIPGLSGSMVLVILGGYQLALSAVADRNIPLLLAMCVGAGLGLIIGSRIISVLLKKFRQGTYCIIIGLVVGSIYTIFPVSEFSFNTQGIIGIVLLLVGLGLPALMSSLDRKTAEEK